MIPDIQQQALEKWEFVLEELRKRIRPQQFETWFAPLKVRQFTSTSLILVVPNKFYCEWLENNYLGLLHQTIYEMTGSSPTIHFVVEHTAEISTPTTETAARETAMPVPTPSESPGLPFAYTFENFVVGACNRLAHAAALAIVESPGKAYNPFFLHGAVGLGKTHLLLAICHALRQKDASLKLRYLTCETFMNEFITAIQQGSTEAFREKYRQCDLIVVDDVQFLSKGEGTQEEFFHTFNALYNNQKQIILSSDRPPEEIRSIEERLISRFKWGLVCRLDAPDFETRVAIIQKKARALNREFPMEVVTFIASNIENNIRELEGAINRVIGFARLENKPITLPLAKEALQDICAPRRPIGIEQIIQHVAAAYNLKVADLLSKKKTKSVALPRQICMHLARKLTSHSLGEIGGYFGGRDHTTVLYADSKICELTKKDPALAAMLAQIINELQKL